MLFLIIAMISYILMVLSFVFRYKDEKLHAMAFISFVFFLFSIIISFSEDNEEEHFIEVFNKNKQYIESNISENKIENAKSLGFEVINIDKSDPVEEVKKLTGGKGVDAVIVAVGNSIANNQAVEMIKDAYGRIRS